jgi:hypothetical protein
MGIQGSELRAPGQMALSVVQPLAVAVVPYHAATAERDFFAPATLVPWHGTTGRCSDRSKTGPERLLGLKTREQLN